MNIVRRYTIGICEAIFHFSIPLNLGDTLCMCQLVEEVWAIFKALGEMKWEWDTTYDRNAEAFSDITINMASRNCEYFQCDNSILHKVLGRYFSYWHALHRLLHAKYPSQSELTNQDSQCYNVHAFNHKSWWPSLLAWIFVISSSFTATLLRIVPGVRKLGSFRIFNFRHVASFIG